MPLAIIFVFSFITFHVAGVNVELSSMQNFLKPVFVKVPPKNLYVTASEPAVVECIAKQATVLHINCLNDADTILKTSTSSLLDQSKDSFYFQNNKKNGQDQLDQISKAVQGNIHAVNLTLREKTVESWFVRQFWCQCEAAFLQDQSTTQDFMISKKSYIEIAYIDKTFKQEPNPASLYLGRYAKLTCIAPDGNPKPKVFWKKDGKKLVITDSTKTQVSEDGSLVLFSTSPADNGVYQCVAFNDAGTRLSNEAKLEVLEPDENGDWMQWTPWNACPTHCVYGQYCVEKCLKYLRRRSRLCKATGKEKIKCPGPSLQTESCANVCRVDGQWGKWSEWSLCQRDCIRQRSRICDSPSPQAGGMTCLPKGRYTIKENCSIDLCQQLETPLPQTRFVFRDMIVYLVLSIALFLLIIIATIVICLQKKQFMFSPRSEYMPRKLDADKGQFVLLKSISERGILRKDINSDSIGTFNSTSSNNSPLPIKENILKTDHSISPINFPFSGQFPPKQTSSPANPISCHYKETDLSSSTNVTKYPMTSPPLLVTQIFLPTLPEDECNPQNIPITNAGGKILLGSTGISVTIMPDTIHASETLGVNLHSGYHDAQLCGFDEHTQLSSTIYCSLTKNIKLKRPVIFTFPHCIYWKSMSSWEIKLMKKNIDLKWTTVVTMDNLHQSNVNIYCHLDEEYCYIMTSEVFSFCLLGYSITSTPLDQYKSEIRPNPDRDLTGPQFNLLQPIMLSTKRLCVISILEPSNNSGQSQLSCYIFIDTKDTRDFLISKVLSVGSRIVDIPKVLFFHDSKDSVYISVQSACPCWTIHLKHKYQEVSFRDLWNIKTEPFTKKVINITHIDNCVLPFNGVISVHQEGFFKDKVDINVSFNLAEIISSINKIPVQINPNHTPCKFITSSKTFRLPRATIRELANHLDPPKLTVSQWLMIAKQIGITNNLEYFLSQSSPTTYLMMLWEAKNREETALVDLKSTLKVIGLVDMATVFK